MKKRIFNVEGSLNAKFESCQIAHSEEEVLRKALSGSEIKIITLTLDNGQEVVLDCCLIEYNVDRVETYNEEDI